MDFLDGVHIDEYLARNPSQEERNEFALKIIRGHFRLLFTSRLSYADFHPGNFLFMDDGRLGFIDFGFMVTHTDEEWAILEKMDRALTTGCREDRSAANKAWCYITDDLADAERLRLADDFSDWIGRCRYYGGPFDFGDEDDFRRGVDLFTAMVRKRYNRARPCTPAIGRQNFGLRAMLYRLKAKIDIRPITEEEVKATGWDRSEYA
jgi:hypothetical protein